MMTTRALLISHGCLSLHITLGTLLHQIEALRDVSGLKPLKHCTMTLSCFLPLMHCLSDKKDTVPHTE